MSIVLDGTTGIDLPTTLTTVEGGTGLDTPGTSGNVLTSNGTTWISSSPIVGLNGVAIITASGSWAVPAGVTKARITVIGGGAGTGNGCGDTPFCGGFAQAFCSGLAGTLSITIGAGGAGNPSGTGFAGGTSSCTGTGVSITATGGNATGLTGAGTVTTGTLLRAPAAGVINLYSVYQGIHPTTTFFTSGKTPSTTGITPQVYSPSGLYGAGFPAESNTDNQGGVGGVVVIEY